ncbi:MAG TPA: glycosyltransferase family 39 protein [Pseudonocardia sp.]|uniref:glycosyltransferase family 39 protein n=1 Tax=Pseudonocardia sp. TaxID=60912 RepID=UPI002EDAD6C1
MTATLDRAVPTGSTPAPAPRTPAERFGLTGLLGTTAMLNLWGLAASGWANSFYAAAVWAGTRSWKALLFGAFDPAGFITVDKPPASMWVMGLSARIFGFSSWSMLVPQALMGVASVALLYASVRRVAGPVAGLLAGAVLALTPVAVLMFRFNNPDALLVLLLVLAAYCTTRAVERASTRWLVLTGVAVGFGFLAKMGAALVVVPALALAYLVAAPTGLGRRIRQLLAAGVALVLSAGWYLALVALWPASQRPYIGGSRTNSLVELALGYNGLSRLLGRSGDGQTGHGGGFGRGGLGFGGGGFGGEAGLSRLFGESVGGQGSWLLPAAVALLVIGLWLTRRAPRTDRTRAALLLWGGWLLVTAALFSFMAGIFHPYYTVALAPAIAAVLAIGGRELFARRDSWPYRAIMAVLLAGTGALALALLDRTPEWAPALHWSVLALTAIAVVAVLTSGGGRHRVVSIAAVAVLAGLLAPAGYAVRTALTPHTGSTPSAGPTTAAGFADAADRRGRGTGMAAQGFGGREQAIPLDPAQAAVLRAAGTTWSAATIGARGASSVELSSQTAVMAIGGFIGSDPAPTLAQFQADVAAGRIHYFIPEQPRGGPGGQPGGGQPGRGQLGGGQPGGAQPGGGRHGDSRGTSAEITTWVTQHFAPITIGGQTWYDLTRPVSG